MSNNIKELLKWSYDLNESESEVFLLIIENNGLTPLSIKDIMKKIEKDRTTIQKIIKRLLNLNLVFRGQVNLDRGFKFHYRGIEKSTIFENCISKNLQEFKTRKEDIIVKFGDFRLNK